MPLAILSHGLNSVVHMVRQHEKETTHAYLLEMREVKVFGIHSKVEARLTNLYGGFGLSYSRVAAVTMPTLSGAMVVL